MPHLSFKKVNIPTCGDAFSMVPCDTPGCAVLMGASSPYYRMGHPPPDREGPYCSLVRVTPEGGIRSFGIRDCIVPSDMWGVSVTRMEDGKVLMFGGHHGDEEAVNSLYTYNMGTNEWTEVPHTEGAPWPQGKWRHFAFAIGSVLVIGAGVPSLYHEDWDNDALMATWAYDTETGIWTRLAGYPTPNVYWASGTLVGDTFHLIGKFTHMTFSLRDGWTVLCDHDTHTHLGPGQCAVCTIGQYVVCMGGNGYTYRTVNAYDTVSGTWEKWATEGYEDGSGDGCAVPVGGDSILLRTDGHCYLVTLNRGAMLPGCIQGEE
ncbi:hypothetical protein KIPB_006132 [Kipferlia bialata]|uniref:Uncharacterized protein n=1 Tax=Kipferlia bialata TaxID=797122 RepID=A0A9K3CZQ5_9EUKA|nr:hypothetical protein KIPB_006132 [Kipferlia bialata]|eukprot:g6132.t1